MGTGLEGGTAGVLLILIINFSGSRIAWETSVCAYVTSGISSLGYMGWDNPSYLCATSLDRLGSQTKEKEKAN